VVLKKIIALRQILPYLLVLVVGFFLFKSTISSTSLYGDEWKTLWLGEAAIHNTGSIFQQPSMEFSYIFATIIFHLIYKIAGFNSTYYYAFSFLTRLIAAIFFLLFLKNRGLSKISSFLGSMIFMISPVGIETTDWAKNFDSYLGVVSSKKSQKYFDLSVIIHDRDFSKHNKISGDLHHFGIDNDRSVDFPTLKKNQKNLPIYPNCFGNHLCVTCNHQTFRRPAFTSVGKFFVSSFYKVTFGKYWRSFCPFEAYTSQFSSSFLFSNFMEKTGLCKG